MHDSFSLGLGVFRGVHGLGVFRGVLRGVLIVVRVVRVLHGQSSQLGQLPGQ